MIDGKKVIAVIPARGGSKGVPRKNVRDVAGKPLIAWTVEAALCAKCVDTVAVSTDDAEIASVAERYGARVVRRPAEISGDEASSESALLHALQKLGGDLLGEPLPFVAVDEFRLVFDSQGSFRIAENASRIEKVDSDMARLLHELDIG